MIRLFSLLVLTAFALGGTNASAADGDQRMLALNQWVRLPSDGVIAGTVVIPTANGGVSTVESASVVLTDQEGGRYRGTADSSGRFVVGPVPPGIYSLTARGENTYACYALHVVASDAPGAQRYPETIDVLAARAAGPTVKTASLRYLPARLQQASDSLQGVKLDTLADDVCDRALMRVAQIDGGMVGQIRLAGAIGDELLGAADMNVFVFADEVEVTRTITDQDGRFRIESLQPGEYTAITVGGGGMGVVGFELVAAGAPVPPPLGGNDGSSTRLVTQGATGAAPYPCDMFMVQVAPLPDGDEPLDDEEDVEEIVEEEVVYDDGFATPFGGGYGASSFGGGGGGGGGFGIGGIGAMASLGAAAAIISADEDEDDGGNLIPPPPASPAIP